jgi:hypothetical protein
MKNNLKSSQNKQLKDEILESKKHSELKKQTGLSVLFLFFCFASYRFVLPTTTLAWWVQCLIAAGPFVPLALVLLWGPFGKKPMVSEQEVKTAKTQKINGMSGYSVN